MSTIIKILNTIRILVIISLIHFVVPEKALSSTFELKLGPAGVGNGGPNPLSIPPSVADLALTYVTDSGFETNISVFPGLLFGMRSNPKRGAYVSLGGGIAIAAAGTGIGMYTGFGYTYSWFVAEYQQVLGVCAGQVISPYAIRIGMSINW